MSKTVKSSSGRNTIIFLSAIVIVGILGGIWFNANIFNDKEKEQKSLTASQQEPSKLAYLVDAKTVIPSVQRLGINLTDLNDYSLDSLRKVNPSYLRYKLNLEVEDFGLNHFLELCKQVGANPWIVFGEALTKAQVSFIGSELNHNADTSKFSNVFVEFEKGSSDNDEVLLRLKSAAGANVNLTPSGDLLKYSEWNINPKNDQSREKFIQSVVERIYSNKQPQIIFQELQSEGASSNQATWNATGRVVILLNQILGGSLHKLILTEAEKESPNPLNKQLTLSAFRSGNEWSVLVVSNYEKPIQVTIQFPNDALKIPNVINEHTDGDSNGTKVQSRIDQNSISFEIPAKGIIILGH